MNEWYYTAPCVPIYTILSGHIIVAGAMQHALSHPLEMQLWGHVSGLIWSLEREHVNWDFS
jgi:hypothetical protein